MPLLNVSISCKVSMLPFVCVLKLTAFRTYDLKLSTRTRAATSRRDSVRLISTTGRHPVTRSHARGKCGKGISGSN